MHGGREPGDFDYLWAGKKGTTMIKGAIFDMDGTLVDNTPVHIRAFEIFCERYGIRDWKEKLGQAYGMGNDDIMRLIMPAEVIREKGLAALAEEKESIYREIYAPEIVPMPGLTDLLQKLRDAGIRCAVGSSGYKPNVDFVLEKCRIEPYFDARISGDMVSRCKPDPEIYLTAAAAWGCLRRNASSSKTPRRGSKQHAGPEPDISWRWPRRSTAQRWRRPMRTGSSTISATSPTSTLC